MRLIDSLLQHAYLTHHNNSTLLLSVLFFRFRRIVVHTEYSKRQQHHGRLIECQVWSLKRRRVRRVHKEYQERCVQSRRNKYYCTADEQERKRSVVPTERLLPPALSLYMGLKNSY